jgi:hypothetical protein
MASEESVIKEQENGEARRDRNKETSTLTGRRSPAVESWN